MVLVYSRCTLECAYESATGNAKMLNIVRKIIYIYCIDTNDMCTFNLIKQ